MALEFKFPDVGEGIAEGLIVKWRVKEGDIITQDQIIVDVETDKAIVEIPSPHAGTVLKIHFAENETVKVGEILVTIGQADEKIAPKKAPAVVGELAEELSFATPEKISAPEKTSKGWETNIPPAMPRVRQIAKELGIDLSLVHGTGPGGRISEDDVRNMAQDRIAGEASKYGPVERTPFTGTRKSIAERLTKTALSAAMVTHFDMADMGPLDILRKKIETKDGKKISYLAFFIRAIVGTLKQFPNFNASLDELASEVIYKKYYNIGIAVDTDHGLLVPVIRDADRKSVDDLMTLLKAYALRARDKSLGLEEMRGGSFTISNIGAIGGIFATPIMSYPQSSILVIGKIHEAPVVRDGKVAIVKQAPLSLSFDHRLIDGADAARFTNHLIEELSHPEGLL